MKKIGKQFLVNVCIDLVAALVLAILYNKEIIGRETVAWIMLFFVSSTIGLTAGSIHDKYFPR